jgi:hypothetical protein
MFAIATEVEAFYNEGVLLKQNTATGKGIHRG